MESAFSENDVTLITSYLRVGASLSDAFDALAWPADHRNAFLTKFALEIKQAQAQCRILCLHNIMTEGGQSGSRFILEQQVIAADGTEKPAGVTTDFSLDFGDFSL
ncbi:MAG TPA: hypothetical protein PLC97_11770 [Myxococcota bacterium]|nr:hypothetical protein [Myxococcota bacterium]